MNYIFLLLFSAFYGHYQTSETIDIKVTVTNITNQKGSVRLGVFNSSKTFLKEGKEYKTYAQKPSGETLVFHLKGLAKDDYAISLYHDINSDNKCNLNLLFRPSEPYGFSNNVKLKLFKPNFEDCKFTANEDLEIKINLVD